MKNCKNETNKQTYEICRQGESEKSKKNSPKTPTI